MFNGTVADEREVVAAYLELVGIGEGYVASSLTNGRGVAWTVDEGRSRRAELAGLSEETLADFITKNRERYPVDPDLNPGGRLICLDEEFNRLFEDIDGWRRFYQMFPDSPGIVDFSRVGFDREVTQALMYASDQTGWLAGSGNCWLFSKSNGVWAQEGLFGLWIS